MDSDLCREWHYGWLAAVDTTCGGSLMDGKERGMGRGKGREEGERR